MSSYHSSFKYLNKKSDEDFGWIITHFDPDNGENDSYLSQEQVYSNSYNGSKRILYGTRWNSVANIKITVVKQDGNNFTLDECRRAYKWLTGNPEASWMDLYVGNTVKYRLLCTIQDVKPQKMDARTVGLNIYCESLSPWAYSALQTVESTTTEGGTQITIENLSDDIYSFVYAKTTYENESGESLTIENTTTGEKTSISGLGVNETVILDNNMFITSSNPSKIFGNSFNFVWPRFKSDENNLIVSGNGKIKFEYYYAIKMGDCAVTINELRGQICDSNGNIAVDSLDWSMVSNTPNTIGGYGINDVYTKREVDDLLNGLTNKNSEIYVQPDEPLDAPNYALWVDVDE